jgi:hypothetical protein
VKPDAAFNDELQHGDPRWAAKLASGMMLFLIGAVLFAMQMAAFE